MARLSLVISENTRAKSLDLDRQRIYLNALKTV
jgi:hypothetical protein